MCCDALKLASASKIERLFLLTNDGDFIPFCRAIKEFGANISIVHLSSAGAPNGELLREADSFHVIGLEHLEHIFAAADISAEDKAAAPAETAAGAEGQSTEVAKSLSSEKPEAEPSDLIVEAGDN
jgi:hypothetical protein